MSDKSLMQRVIERTESQYVCSSYPRFGVNGKACLAVDTGPVSCTDFSFVAEIIDVLAGDEFTDDDHFKIADDLRHMKIGDLWKGGRIVYFPSLEFVEGEESDDAQEPAHP